MYKQFFGLRENPFNVNPDPRYLFLTPQLRDALDTLTFGIQTRKGLILLTGEVGTGKTTLINCLLDWLHQQQTATAFIFNPRLETHHLFDFILADFGVSFDRRTGSNPLMRLNEFLLERFRGNENSVLIVDEAQGLSFDFLEEIRLLLNQENPREKLLQVVLVGQPELEEKLMRHELRLLRQRITLRCRTAPLTSEETHAYIQMRLHIAGSHEKPVFATEAIDALHFYAQGIPRLINLLSEHSLINAYVDNLQPVPACIVEEVAHEFELDGVKHSVRTADLMEAAGAQSILGESTFTKARLPLLSVTEPTRQAQFVGGICSTSVPFLVTEPTTLTNGGSTLPSLADERISERAASTEEVRRETELSLDSAEFTSEDAFRLLCELALESKTIASTPRLTTNGSRTQTPWDFSKKWIGKLRTQPIRWRAWWTTHWSSITSSLGRTRTISSLLHWLKQAMNPVQLTYRRWRAWPLGFSSMALPEMAASFIRWLQEPWDARPERLPHGRAIRP